MSCEAKRQGIVRVRGKSSIEWHKDGKPQYYCYGYMDSFTDELLTQCAECAKHVDKAQDDSDAWNRMENKHE